MKASSIIELKEELSALPAKSLVELCLRMARYKKENKELLTYVLFESHDEHGFVQAIKKDLDEAFAALPLTNWYFVKKGLRRILRQIGRHSRHSGIKTTEIEIGIHFCVNCKEYGITESNQKAISNLYERQLSKLNALAGKVHEDLHFDYLKQIKALEL